MGDWRQDLWLPKSSDAQVPWPALRGLRILRQGGLTVLVLEAAPELRLLLPSQLCFAEAPQPQPAAILSGENFVCQCIESWLPCRQADQPVSALHPPRSPCQLPKCRSSPLRFLLDLKQKKWASTLPRPPPHHLPPFSTVTCTFLSLAKNLSWEWWASSLRTAWL